MLAVGCSLVVGCSYDFDAPFSSMPYAGVDGGHDAVSDAPNAADAFDAAQPPCDEDEQPLGAGIFVSATGGNDTAAGTSSSPVKSLAKAMELAASAEVADIYVDEGTYPEAVAIRSATVLHGGWRRQSASWTRDCQVNARLRTLINPQDGTVVSVTGFSGKAGIEDVTLATDRANGDEGESMLALWISAVGVQFRAVNIDVAAAAGGDGANPVPPADPGAKACNGHSDVSTGQDGSPGADGPPATAGKFQQSGFVPGDGEVGTDGSPGANGTAGGAGHTQSGCDSCGGPPDCLTVSTGDLTSGDGSCGCGGKPGLAGPAGRGGGASVGIFVAGQGTVLTLVSSTVRASDGGDGSAGVAGPGGTGSDGASGYSPFCGTCISMPPGCGLSGGYISGGSAGGPGGKGGAGGKGGGGAGGPSHGIAVVAGATASIDAMTLQAIALGKGGVGADGAPEGASTPVLNLP